MKEKVLFRQDNVLARTSTIAMSEIHNLSMLQIAPPSASIHQIMLPVIINCSPILKKWLRTFF